MAYDEHLADEVRERLAHLDVEEKKMFGGLAFMVDGNLTVAASRKGGLLVRTDPADADDLLGRPGVEAMEMNGVTKPGWLWVGAEALADEREVGAWVERALAFVETLPAK
jgi:TfoX/Sxy family transcriptional regulator of competence genes